MKKTYISPAINVVQIQVTMAAASLDMDNKEGDASNSLGRHNSIQWLDDDEEDI